MPEEQGAGGSAREPRLRLSPASLIRVSPGVPDTRKHALRGWRLLAYAMAPIGLMIASTAYHLTRPGGGSLSSLQARGPELVLTFILLVLIPLDVGGAVRRGILAKFPDRGQVAFVAGFLLTAAAFVLASSWPLVALLAAASAISARRSSAYSSTKSELDRHDLMIASAEGAERGVLLRLRRGLMMKWRDAEKAEAFRAVVQFSLICAAVFSLGWVENQVSELFERQRAAKRGPTEIHQVW